MKLSRIDLQSLLLGNYKELGQLEKASDTNSS
jgi:hypothetical protein